MKDLVQWNIIETELFLQWDSNLKPHEVGSANRKAKCTLSNGTT